MTSWTARCWQADRKLSVTELMSSPLAGRSRRGPVIVKAQIGAWRVSPAGDWCQHSGTGRSSSKYSGALPVIRCKSLHSIRWRTRNHRGDHRKQNAQTPINLNYLIQWCWFIYFDHITGWEGREGEGKRGERRGSLCWPDHFSKADYGSDVSEADKSANNFKKIKSQTET